MKNIRTVVGCELGHSYKLTRNKMATDRALIFGVSFVGVLSQAKFTILVFCRLFITKYQVHRMEA
jgi:hypothetical protein